MVKSFLWGVGELKYESITPEGFEVRAGQEASFRIRYTAVYIKLDDRWQMVAWQSTRLP